VPASTFFKLFSKTRTASSLGLLEQPRTYRAEIEKLHRKMLQRGEGAPVEGNISVGAAAFQASKISRLIAREIMNGTYRFSPARRHIIRWREKERDIYLLSTTDLIVHGAVATLLAGRLEPILPDSVYSYRADRDRLQALHEFAKYVRDHSRGRPKKEQGLFVLRGDVKSYTDSIPVDEESPLWPKIFGLIGDDPKRKKYDALLRRCIRVTVFGLGDAECSMMKGVATGSPMSTVCANLYLLELDRELSGLGGFYARYGDDILFAHEDEKVTRLAETRADAILAELHLSMNAKKKKIFYFNGAGRAAGGYPGKHQVEFLGSIVDFKGFVSLGKDSHRMFIRAVRRSLRRLGPKGGIAERGQAACRIVRAFLSASGDEAVPERQLVMRAVTDRNQLKVLDYEIALAVAEVVTGKKGTRAFRDAPYRKMRNVWRLPSITLLRNRARKRKSR